MVTRLKHLIKNWIRRKAVILMYHQVCVRRSDPWQLAVTPEHFDEQLSLIRKNFDVVSLDELATGLRQHKLGSKKLAITFDDGFCDNYTNARPMLESYKLPATFYFTTHMIDSGQLYWWDELEFLILHSEKLPRQFHLRISDEEFHFDFLTDDTLNARLIEQIRNWDASEEPSNERISLFLSLWKRMQPLPFDQQQKILVSIRIWAGIPHVDQAHAPVMGMKELTDLGSNPLFSVGAHTVHHAMLAKQERHVQAFEIQESKKVIEGLLGRKITSFSYPYGNYNAFTKLLLRDAGFKYAVSTDNRPVYANDDVFELPRMQVRNWSGEEFSERLQQLFQYEK
jgi:peptidoglycan/xylan/chitin deacetylase (PgdA/CDA1 family)